MNPKLTTAPNTAALGRPADPAVRLFMALGFKAKAWLAKGATPSETVESILKKAGVLSA